MTREELAESDEKYLESVAHQNVRIEAYLVQLAAAAAIVADMTQYLDDHGEVAPDDITWAHVGSMRRLHNDLQDIQNYIRNLES